MLGQLKDRFLSFQEEISSSVKQLAPSEQYSGVQPSKNQLEAGSELLETWQNHWEDLHLNNERNAKIAARCDQKISQVRNRTKLQWNSVTAVQAHIPKINSGIKDIMDKLGTLESLIGDVELALLALEDTIDAREMQEKQLDQRFQLAMYQERRKAEFNELATRLQTEYDRKKQQSDMKKKEQQKNKRKVLQKQFEEDMNQFKNDGLLHVPSRHDPDASLESVDLDDPDPDGNTLEAFLNEPDVLYDVSPLPKDDTTPILQKLESTSNIPTPTVSNVDEISPTNPASCASGVVSREESMYFTPDATTEKLSEISLE